MLFTDQQEHIVKERGSQRICTLREGLIHLDNLKNYSYIYVVISSYTNLGIKLTTADNNSDQITKQCIYRLTTEHVKPSLCV